MIGAVIIGLWAWLFVETLTHEGHIFASVAINAIRKPLFRRYVECPVCHAGIVSLFYAVFETGMAIDLTLPTEFLVTLTIMTTVKMVFAYTVIAMSVAKIMSLKF